jgi:isopenicillin-N epimerase
VNVDLKYGHHLREHFLLDERLVFLNHGSFGACPKVVLKAQSEWRERLEKDPVAFMLNSLPTALRSQADELGKLLGAEGKDIAFVENATTGVNAVMRGLRLDEGDELLTLNHVYPAVDNTLKFLAARAGCKVVRADVPMPVTSPEQVVAAVVAGLTPKTRIAVIDHVTSFSGLVTPIADIVRACHDRGVPVLVDGAHAPGMLKLDLESIGADYYVGNCHKWLWAPKGCAFLHVASRNQADMHPTVISNMEPLGFPHNFDWTGTKDPSAWLSLSAALEFHRSLGGSQVAKYNHNLVVEGAGLLEQALDFELVAPQSMTGSIRAVRLPNTEAAGPDEAAALHGYLAHEHNIEVLVHAHEGIWLRVSAQIYNEISDYERLVDGLKKARSLGIYTE